MSQFNSVPTVEEVLSDTAIGYGWHDFRIEGGTIRVPTKDLRRVLEAAYNPSMANWSTLVDESDFFD